MLLNEKLKGLILWESKMSTQFHSNPAIICQNLSISTIIDKKKDSFRLLWVEKR